MFEDVASTEVAGFERQDSNLLVRYSTGDVLTVQYFFSSPTYQIEKFTFADGVTWTPNDINTFVSALASFGGGSAMMGSAYASHEQASSHYVLAAH